MEIMENVSTSNIHHGINSSLSQSICNNKPNYKYLYVASVLFVGAIFIVTVNTLIIAAPFVYPSLRKKTYVFVSSLAVADILTALLHSGIAVMVIIRDFTGATLTCTNTYCRILIFLYLFPQAAAVFNILLLAVDR